MEDDSDIHESESDSDNASMSSSGTYYSDASHILSRERYYYATPLNDAHAATFCQHVADTSHPPNLAFYSDKTLTKTGAELIATAIRQSEFKRLVFTSVETSASALIVVLQAIQQVPTLQSLQLLKLPINEISCLGAMVTMPSLETFIIKGFSACLTSLASLSIGLSQESCCLRELNLSYGLLTNDEIRTLCLGLRNNSSIRSLFLCRNRIGDDGIAIFVENWNQDSTIENLNVDHNPIGRQGAQALIRAVAKHPVMLRLSLLGHTQMGYSGMEMIEEELPNFNVSEVNVCKCFGGRFFKKIYLADEDDSNQDDSDDQEVDAYGNESDAHMIRLKCSIVESNMHHAFSIRVDQIHDVGAILAHMPSLLVFNVNMFDLRGPNLHSLSDDLTLHASLTDLELGRAGLGDEGMMVLSTGLGNNRSLRRLSIYHNDIGDEGLVEFLRHWSTDSQIQTLDFSENLIRPEGARLLLREIANHDTMRSLDLSGNFGLQYAGFKVIGEELSTLRLEHLDISCIAREVLFFSLPEDYVAAGRALVQGIKENVHLRELTLNAGVYKAFGACPNAYGPMENFVYFIYFYIALNRWGRRLLTEHHGLASTVWCNILAKAQTDEIALKNDYLISLIYFFLREQPNLARYCQD
jgi:hypothetical protein